MKFLFSQKSAKHFLWKFALSFMAIISIYAVIAVWANVYWGFGEKGFFIKINERRLKSEHLQSLPTEQLHQSYIMGSSNTLPFQPNDIEKLFGLTAFNLGGFFGKAHEIAAYINFLIKGRKHVPKILFIGIDPWTFSIEHSNPAFLPSYTQEVLHSPLLIEHLPGVSPAKLLLSDLANVFSLEYAELMTARALLRYKVKQISHKSLTDHGFSKHGTYIPYDKREWGGYVDDKVNEVYEQIQKLEKQGKEIPAYLKDKQKEYIDLFLVPRRWVSNYISKQQFAVENSESFENAMHLTMQKGIYVVFIILPTHPYFRDLVEKHNHYQRLLSNVKQHVQRYQEHYPKQIMLFDASNLNNFNGSVWDFKDINHMTPDNTYRVLKEVRSKLPKDWLP